LRIMPLLPKSMMRLGSIRARLTCLLLGFPDPRLLMSDLRTVWPDVSRDTTMIAGRLTSFAEMLLERLCKFKIIIFTNNKVYGSYGEGHIYLKRFSQYNSFRNRPASSKVCEILTNNTLV
jgi:hypothetical protein